MGKRKITKPDRNGRNWGGWVNDGNDANSANRGTAASNAMNVSLGNEMALAPEPNPHSTFDDDIDFFVGMGDRRPEISRQARFEDLTDGDVFVVAGEHGEGETSFYKKYTDEEGTARFAGIVAHQRGGAYANNGFDEAGAPQDFTEPQLQKLIEPSPPVSLQDTGRPLTVDVVNVGSYRPSVPVEDEILDFAMETARTNPIVSTRDLDLGRLSPEAQNFLSEQDGSNADSLSDVLVKAGAEPGVEGTQKHLDLRGVAANHPGREHRPISEGAVISSDGTAVTSMKREDLRALRQMTAELERSAIRHDASIARERYERLGGHLDLALNRQPDSPDVRVILDHQQLSSLHAGLTISENRLRGDGNLSRANRLAAAHKDVGKLYAYTDPKERPQTGSRKLSDMETSQ